MQIHYLLFNVHLLQGVCLVIMKYTFIAFICFIFSYSLVFTAYYCSTVGLLLSLNPRVSVMRKLNVTYLLTYLLTYLKASATGSNSSNSFSLFILYRNIFQLWSVRAFDGDTVPPLCDFLTQSHGTG